MIRNRHHTPPDRKLYNAGIRRDIKVTPIQEHFGMGQNKQEAAIPCENRDSAISDTLNKILAEIKAIKEFLK